MLAAVLKDFDRLVLEDIPTPAPGPGQVVVRIKSCGFCATDFKAIKGIRRNVRFPLVPGHEPGGLVAAVGAGVTNVKEGDAVIIQPSGYCGFCHYCRLGLTHYCEKPTRPAVMVRKMSGTGVSLNIRSRAPTHCSRNRRTSASTRRAKPSR